MARRPASKNSQLQRQVSGRGLGDLRLRVGPTKKTVIEDEAQIALALVIAIIYIYSYSLVIVKIWLSYGK